MCPSPSVPAGPMEAFVIDQIRSLGSERQAGFERSWNTLSSSEQHRLIRQLTQVVVYDGQTGQVAITVDDEEMGKLAQRSAGATETRKGVRCVSN